MHKTAVSTKSADFLNNTIFKGGCEKGFAYTFRNPTGRELRRREEREARRNAKKGIPALPSGFANSTLQQI